MLVVLSKCINTGTTVVRQDNFQEQRKQGVQAEMRFAVNEERKRAESELFGANKPNIDEKPKSVLDRFKRKDG